jgi:cytochrome c-type biogenesis protein CcmH
VKRLAATATAVLALALAGGATACTKPRASLASLEGQVMCPICHTTLDQSQSGAAEQIRQLIRQKIARCETEAQIKQELVADYGQSILAAPPHKGFDLLAWWLPLGGIIAGALAIGWGVWRWSRRDPTEPPSPSSRLDPELERRVDEALRGFET